MKKICHVQKQNMLPKSQLHTCVLNCCEKSLEYGIAIESLQI